MNSRKEGGSMLASMTTPTIVPKHPIRQLSGSIIPKKVDPDRLTRSRHYHFFLASVENLFPVAPDGFLSMEDNNV
jgi:hypothetical protein